LHWVCDNARERERGGAWGGAMGDRKGRDTKTDHLHWARGAWCWQKLFQQILVFLLLLLLSRTRTDKHIGHSEHNVGICTCGATVNTKAHGQ